MVGYTISVYKMQNSICKGTSGISLLPRSHVCTNDVQAYTIAKGYRVIPEGRNTHVHRAYQSRYQIAGRAA